MANYRSGNVIVVDTSGAIAGVCNIESIKYVPAGTTPSASIKKESTSGAVMYEVDGETDVQAEVCLRSSQGIYVTLAGTGTKLYIYLK